MMKRRNYKLDKVPEEEQCVGTTKAGARCKRWGTNDTSQGKLCAVHFKELEEAEEVEEANVLFVSAYNKARVEYLITLPDYTFMDADQVIDWLFRYAKETNKLLRFQMDIFEHSMRNPV